MSINSTTYMLNSMVSAESTEINAETKLNVDSQSTRIASIPAGVVDEKNKQLQPAPSPWMDVLQACLRPSKQSEPSLPKS